MVAIIFEYFRSLDSPTARPTGFFDIRLRVNDIGFIDVSRWFRGDKERLNKYINGKEFISLKQHHFKVHNIDPANDEAIIQRTEDGSVFLHPVLAVYIASKVSLEWKYAVLRYCFATDRVE